jgi:hypothetical protein
MQLAQAATVAGRVVAQSFQNILWNDRDPPAKVKRQTIIKTALRLGISTKGWTKARKHSMPADPDAGSR